MLEFVHLSGANAGKDVQTRRKVRSQAMRDFRKRQRSEKAQVAAMIPSHSPQPAKPTSKDETLVFRPVPWSSSPGSSESTSAAPHAATSIHAEGELVLPVSVTVGISAPPTTLCSDTRRGYDGTETPRTHTTHVTCGTHTPVNMPTSIPQGPSLWYTDTCVSVVDRFQSPALISIMFQFCRSYIIWLLPGTTSKIAGYVLSGVMDNSLCPMLLAGCCLASVGHLDAVQPGRPGGHEFYKARVLRDVSQRLQSPDTATAHETVAALGLLASFEISRGNSEEALTHLHGLKNIAIRVKSGVTVQLEALDLLHAVIFDSMLVLNTYGPVYPDSCVGVEEPTMTLALLVAERDEFLLNRLSSFLGHRMIHSIPLHQKACAALTKVLRRSSNLDDDDTTVFDTYRQSLVDFWEAACLDDPAAADSVHLCQACYFEAALFYNTLVMGIPQRHKSNQDLVDRLFHAFDGVTDTTWTHLPYLRLQILLTAAATTRNVSQKSYWKAQLVRAIYQSGPKEWRRVRHFIIRFISLRAVLDHSGGRPFAPFNPS